MLAYLRELYIHQHIILWRVDKLFQVCREKMYIFENLCASQKNFPAKVPDSFALERNASINFVNNPPIFDFARPYSFVELLLIDQVNN
jgi:hypothetical protein